MFGIQRNTLWYNNLRFSPALGAAACRHSRPPRYRLRKSSNHSILRESQGTIAGAILRQCLEPIRAFASRIRVALRGRQTRLTTWRACPEAGDAHHGHARPSSRPKGTALFLCLSLPIVPRCSSSAARARSDARLCIQLPIRTRRAVQQSNPLKSCR